MNCGGLGGSRERLSRTENHGKEVALREGSVVESGATNNLGRRLVRKLFALAILAASVTACSKTDSGDLEVEKPVVGTVTDTLNVPSVEVGTDTTKVAVPDIDINRDTATIK